MGGICLTRDLCVYHHSPSFFFFSPLSFIYKYTVKLAGCPSAVWVPLALHFPLSKLKG